MEQGTSERKTKGVIELNEYQEAKEAANIQNQFLHSLQGLSAPSAMAAVDGALVSMYAYIEVKGYRDKSVMSLDEFLDAVFEKLKEEVKAKIKEEDVGI
jgi:molybdopterin/thiamine biosynthesis adenylyltransferase